MPMPIAPTPLPSSVSPTDRLLSTVVRVLLVVTLIALGGAAGFELGYRFFATSPQSLEEATRAKAQHLVSEIELETERTGRCGQALTELARRGYAPTLRADPWGTAWRVRCHAERGVVESAGPDRRFGTADDIVALTPDAATEPGQRRRDRPCPHRHRRHSRQN